MDDHNEAMRLADDLDRQWRDDALNYDTAIEAATLIRQQDERIAELEARIHTCGPTCSKAGCINRRITAERDTLRAEVERLTLSAARYEALRARHAYLIVSRLMGRESFSSETSRAQIDGFADKARAEVDAFNALTPEQRMNELQAHVDTARKATP